MDDDFKLRLQMGKVAVVYLNTTPDFSAWHVALRRLVNGYGMGDALMFTVPKDCTKAYAARREQTSAKVKLEEKEKERAAAGEAKADVKVPVVDLTGDQPFLPESRSEEQLVIMRALGVSVAMDVVSVRNGYSFHTQTSTLL